MNTSKGLANVALAEIHGISNLMLRQTILSQLEDSSHHISRVFRPRMTITLRHVLRHLMSALAHHVCHIVVMRSEEQMSHAGRRIA